MIAFISSIEDFFFSRPKKKSFEDHGAKLPAVGFPHQQTLKTTLTQHSQPSEEKRLVDQGAVRAASGGEGVAGGEQVHYS